MIYKMLRRVAYLMAISGLVLMVACGQSGSSHADETGLEYTSAYVCPMHCEGSGSDKAGTCPVCNMDYVINEEHSGHDADHDHNHDHDHDGHDHDH